MEKNSFILYTNYFEILKDLSDSDLGIMFRAILSYKTTGNYELPSHLQLAFKFLKNQLDIDNEKWFKTKEKRSQAGKKGNEKRWGKRFDKQESYRKQSQTIANYRKTSQTSHNVNDNVNVNVNVNDNVNENVNIKKEINKEKSVPKALPTKFVKPSKQELKDFALQEHLTANIIDEFFDYYDSNGWKVGRNPMKDWKATYRRWCRNQHETKEELQEKERKRKEEETMRRVLENVKKRREEEQKWNIQ